MIIEKVPKSRYPLILSLLKILLLLTTAKRLLLHALLLESVPRVVSSIYHCSCNSTNAHVRDLDHRQSDLQDKPFCILKQEIYIYWHIHWHLFWIDKSESIYFDICIDICRELCRHLISIFADVWIEWRESSWWGLVLSHELQRVPIVRLTIKTPPNLFWLSVPPPLLSRLLPQDISTSPPLSILLSSFTTPSRGFHMEHSRPNMSPHHCDEDLFIVLLWLLDWKSSKS